MAYKIEADKCVACGACAGECPNEAIKETGDVFEISCDDCVDCGACVDACPNEAIVEA